MVISRNDNGVIYVLLSDDEKIPQKFNVPNVMVYRRGKSTNREVETIKLLNEIAPQELVLGGIEVCTYTEADPMHQHEDGSWWFYEVNRQFENGPYLTHEDAYEKLQEYCEVMIKIQEAQQPETESSDEILEKE